MFSFADLYQNFYQPAAFPLEYGAHFANYGHEHAAAAAAILASQYQLQLQQLHQLHQDHFQHLHPLLAQQLSPPPHLSPPPSLLSQLQNQQFLEQDFQRQLLQPLAQPLSPMQLQPLAPGQHLAAAPQLQLQQLPLQQQPQQPLQPQQQPQQLVPLSNNATGDAQGETPAEAAKRQRPKKYQCPYCWVALSNTGQYKGHVRIHTGERPFVCDFHNCGKSFTRNEELTRHKRIHTGLRPYACVKCNKCFGRKDHLKKHLRTHDRQESRLAAESRNNDENDVALANLNVSDMNNETPSPASSNDTSAFSIENLTRE